MRRHLRRPAAVILTAAFALAPLALATVDTRPPAHQLAGASASPPPPSPLPRPRLELPPPPPLLAARPVTADPHIVGWALATIPDGQLLAGAGGPATNLTASMVKAWLAGDTLRRIRFSDQPNPAVDRARAAIIDSDNPAATALYHAAGGQATITALIRTCGLTGTTGTPGNWARTLITADDAARLGVCIATGRVAGPAWTPWLLDWMRAVRGPGRFGPVDALPDTDVAMKNGWIIHNGQWHVNCLAIIAGRWSLAVLTRYPAALGQAHGAALCAGVARQLATR